MDDEPYEYLALQRMLREANERAKQLERENAELRTENTRLRKMLADAGFKTL